MQRGCREDWGGGGERACGGWVGGRALVGAEANGARIREGALGLEAGLGGQAAAANGARAGRPEQQHTARKTRRSRRARAGWCRAGARRGRPWASDGSPDEGAGVGVAP